MKPTTKPLRTPDQRAEEEALRKEHAVNPRCVPAGAVTSRSFTAILEMFARFKAARESQGLGLDAVAQRMGMDPSDLARLESGKVLNPPVATLYKWAEALGQELHIEFTSQ